MEYSSHVRFSSGLLYSEKQSLADAIPNGVAISPFAEIPETPSVVVSDDEIASLRCGCGAFMTPFGIAERKQVSQLETWTCVFCGDATNLAPPDPNHPLRLWRTCEIASPSPPSSAVGEGFALVLVLDGNLSQKELLGVNSSVRLALDAAVTAGQRLWLSLIVFTDVVSVYRCGIGGIASADCYSDVVSFNQAPEHVRHQYVASAAAARATFFGALASLRGARKKTRTSPLGEAAPQSCLRRRRNAAERRPRNIGTAVDIALRVTRGSEAPCRIVVCTTGAPDCGYGGISIPYSRSGPSTLEEHSMYSRARAEMDTLSQTARTQGAGVDVFCAGLEPLGSVLLEALVGATSGCVIQQTSFGIEEFGENLSKTLSEQQVPRCGAPPCTLELRTSSNVSLTALIGPAKLCEDKGAVGEEDNRLVIELGRRNPRTTVTLFFEMNGSGSQSSDDNTGGEGRSTSQDAVFFQFVAKACNGPHGSVLRRVTSHRIPFTGNAPDFLKSLDDEVLAVLIGKKAVLTSNAFSSGSFALTFERCRVDACAEVESTLKSIASGHKAMSSADPEASVSRSLPPWSRYALPEELAKLPRTLYSLRHGNLLGEVNKSVDDSFLARLVFLRAGVDDSLLMMAPPLFSTHRIGVAAEDPEQLRPVPAETLALWSNVVAVHDQFSRVVLWRGLEASDEGPDDKQLLDVYAEKAMLKKRLPVPIAVCCREGSSMSRYVVSRLNPSHHDNHDEQLLSFPLLQSLDSDERDATTKKFLRTDVPSFKTWFRSVLTGK